MGRGRSAATRELLEAARDILETIQPCSVRAICYQLFTRGRIPSMAKPETNRISTLLTWAREEDEIPFDWIVQEGRAIEQVSTWDDPAAFARTIQAAYRRNKWAAQAQDLIVVSEKGTVRGTLGPVLDTYEVDFFPVGGYGSTTRVYELAQRATPTRPLVILYLGCRAPGCGASGTERIGGRCKWRSTPRGVGTRRPGSTCPARYGQPSARKRAALP